VERSEKVQCYNTEGEWDIIPLASTCVAMEAVTRYCQPDLTESLLRMWSPLLTFYIDQYRSFSVGCRTTVRSISPPVSDIEVPTQPHVLDGHRGRVLILNHRSLNDHIFSGMST
jgi:hypothetical protein